MVTVSRRKPVRGNGGQIVAWGGICRGKPSTIYAIPHVHAKAILADACADYAGVQAGSRNAFIPQTLCLNAYCSGDLYPTQASHEVHTPICIRILMFTYAGVQETLTAIQRSLSLSITAALATMTSPLGHS